MAKDGTNENENKDLYTQVLDAIERRDIKNFQELLTEDNLAQLSEEEKTKLLDFALLGAAASKDEMEHTQSGDAGSTQHLKHEEYNAMHMAKFLLEKGVKIKMPDDIEGLIDKEVQKAFINEGGGSPTDKIQMDPMKRAVLLQGAYQIKLWQAAGAKYAKDQMALVDSGNPEAIARWNHNTGQTGNAVISEENKHTDNEVILEESKHTDNEVISEESKSKSMFASIKQAFKSAKYTIKTYANAANQMAKDFFKGPSK